MNEEIRLDEELLWSNATSRETAHLIPFAAALAAPQNIQHTRKYFLTQTLFCFLFIHFEQSIYVLVVLRQHKNR